MLASILGVICDKKKKKASQTNYFITFPHCFIICAEYKFFIFMGESKDSKNKYHFSKRNVLK